MYFSLLCLRLSGASVLLAVALPLSAAVVDRIAVIIGNTVITETEVLQEARFKAFLDQAPLDLSVQQRKAAAERLVNQQLLRHEMRIGSYPEPAPAEVESMLRKFRQDHFSTVAQYRASLHMYGVTEEELKRHLTWQLSAIGFVDLRFGASDSSRQSVDGVRTNAGTANADVGHQMDAWLEDARINVRVQFKPEAFQ